MFRSKNRYVPIESAVEEPKREADRDNGNGDDYRVIVDVDNANNELEEVKCDGKENLENRENNMRGNAQIGNVKLTVPTEDAAEPNETAKVPETSARSNYTEQEPTAPLRDTATILQELALQRLSGEFNNVRRRNKDENYRRKDENRDNNGNKFFFIYDFFLEKFLINFRFFIEK